MVINVIEFLIITPFCYIITNILCPKTTKTPPLSMRNGGSILSHGNPRLRVIQKDGIEADLKLLEVGYGINASNSRKIPK
jgi:hypothetical protein